MGDLKVGLTGLGRIGRIHLQNLVQQISNVEVVAVSDIVESAEQVAKQYDIPFHTDFSRVLDHPTVEAVVICSPTETHHPFIAQAARAGKHIFCEKPLEVTAQRIREIEQVVTDANVKLQVGFNRRFDPGFARIHERTRKDIGTLQLINITSRDPAPPPLTYLQGSGGLFMDMTIHDFDMARFIAGAEVIEVYAHGSAMLHPDIQRIGDVDTAVVILKFDNGATAIINNSRSSSYGYDQRVEVFGSNGMAQLANHHEDRHQFYDRDGGHRPRALDFFLERYKDAYRIELQQFVDAIRQGHAVPVGTRAAFEATRIALAAQTSRIENRPVQMSEIN